MGFSACFVPTLLLTLLPLYCCITRTPKLHIVSRGDPAASPCPCENAAWCEPIAHEPGKEVFGFAYPPSKNFVNYDWSQITTVAWNNDPDLMCLAHSHGARVVMSSGDVAEALADEATRAAWVLRTVQLAQELHMDGVNFDMSKPALPGSALASNYTALVRDTALAFHTSILGSQVSVNVPWSPFDIDGRDYEFAALASCADILFVMAYDMQSQIFGRCVASANSPPDLVAKGLRQWLGLGVAANKLVLGLPWYGYDYTCQPDGSGDKAAQPTTEAVQPTTEAVQPTTEAVPPTTEACFLQPVQHLDAPCSDASGSRINYRDVMQILHHVLNTTQVRWDPVQRSPYFNYRDALGAIHQVWFDSPDSLKAKYVLAMPPEHGGLGLLGVGIWHLEALDYTSFSLLERLETLHMWEALQVFTGSTSSTSSMH